MCKVVEWHNICSVALKYDNDMKIEIKNNKTIKLPLQCVRVEGIDKSTEGNPNWKLLMLRRFSGLAHFNTEVCRGK